MQRCETSLKRKRETDTQWALASNSLKIFTKSGQCERFTDKRRKEITEFSLNVYN